MNERIKELAEQALPNIKYWNDELTKEIEAPKNRAVTVDELEKFAELIVRECMRMCDVAAVGYEEHGNIKEANGCVLASKYIAEHLGVE
jgi:hypothetical protein